MGSLVNLPDELLVELLGLLSDKDALNFTEVCKKTHGLKKTIRYKEFYDLSTYNINPNVLRGVISTPNFSCLKNLEELEVTASIDMLPEVSKLTSLRVFSSCENLDKALEHAISLRELNIGFYPPDFKLPPLVHTLKVKTLPKSINLANVKKLTVDFVHTGFKFPDHLEDLHTKYVPDTEFVLPKNLKKFAVNSSCRPVYPHGLRKLKISGVVVSQFHINNIPDTVEKIRFDTPIDDSAVLSLPKRLKCLQLSYGWILPETLPETLEKLIITETSYPKTLPNLRSLEITAIHLSCSNLPMTLKTLYIMACSCEIPLVLPEGLQELAIIRSNIQIANLPETLETLEIYQVMSVLKRLPSKLKVLHLGNGFDQDIIVPSTVVRCRITDNFTSNITFEGNAPLLQTLTLPAIFNFELLANLPKNIIVLSFGLEFNYPVKWPLPTSIRYLTFGAVFNQRICELPFDLRVLRLGERFVNHVPTLPKNLHTLVLPGKLVSDIPDIKSYNIKNLHAKGVRKVSDLPKSLRSLQVETDIEFDVPKHINVIPKKVFNFFLNLKFYSC